MTALLRRAGLLDILERYRALVASEAMDDQGEIVEKDMTPRIRAVFSAAWDAYATSTNEPLDGAGFRAYLETHPEQIDALTYLSAIGDLLHEISLTGLSNVEIRISTLVVLGQFTPSSMQWQQLQDAIDAGAMSESEATTES